MYRLSRKTNKADQDADEFLADWDMLHRCSTVACGVLQSRPTPRPFFLAQLSGRTNTSVYESPKQCAFNHNLRNFTPEQQAAPLPTHR